MTSLTTLHCEVTDVTDYYDVTNPSTMTSLTTMTPLTPVNNYDDAITPLYDDLAGPSWMRVPVLLVSRSLGLLDQQIILVISGYLILVISGY